MCRHVLKLRVKLFGGVLQPCVVVLLWREKDYWNMRLQFEHGFLHLLVGQTTVHGLNRQMVRREFREMRRVAVTSQV